jgi:hypothetical protein
MFCTSTSRLRDAARGGRAGDREGQEPDAAFQLKPKTRGAAIRAQHALVNIAARQKTSGETFMTPSIPTYRPIVTPSRFAWLLAVVAVSGNLYLIVGEALAASSNASTVPVASACLDSLRVATPADVNARGDLQTRAQQ